MRHLAQSRFESTPLHDQKQGKQIADNTDSEGELFMAGDVEEKSEDDEGY